MIEFRYFCSDTASLPAVPVTTTVEPARATFTTGGSGAGVVGAHAGLQTRIRAVGPESEIVVMLTLFAASVNQRPAVRFASRKSIFCEFGVVSSNRVLSNVAGILRIQTPARSEP